MRDFIDQHHLMRRGLLITYSYIFLNITHKLLCGEVVINAFKITAYGIFTGILTLMLKFYFDSRNIEIKGTIAEVKREDVADIAKEKREDIKEEISKINK